MVIKVGWSGTTAEKVVKLLLDGSGRPALMAGDGIRGSREPFGDGDAAAIGKLKLALLEATCQGQAWTFKSVFQAIKFFLLDCELERGFVEQSDRGATAQCGDAENVHG
jgi:hypothetical protein